MAISWDDIHAVADRLASQGQSPTLAHVRRELGGGSYTTISEAMQAWRARREAAEQAQIIPVPEAVQVRTHALTQEIWEAAQQAANDRLESERRALAQTRASTEAQVSEAARLADELAAELDQAKLALAAERETVEGLRGEALTLSDQRDEAQREAAGLAQRMTDLDRDREASRREAREALERAARLAGEMTGVQAEAAAIRGERDRQREQAEAQAVELARLQAVLESERTERARDQQRLERQQQALAEARGEAREAMGRAARLEGQFEQAQAEIHRLGGAGGPRRRDRAGDKAGEARE